MSDEYTDAVMDDLLTRANGEMTTLAGEIEQDIRTMIGDAYPPASEPGTPPHRRKGGYQDGFEHQILRFDQEDKVQLTVLNQSPLALWLEKGTKNEDGSTKMAPRPHFETVFDQYKDAVPDRVIDAINKPKT